VLFGIFAINILYLFVYSIGSLCRKRIKLPPVKNQKHFAILIAAYKEDRVIMDCVQSCLAQNYPSELFDTVVISDHMLPDTHEELSMLPIKLLTVHFDESTKSKSLNYAMQEIGDGYDIAVVLDADNIIPPTYLSDLNRFFEQQDAEIVQTHRTAKNLNTKMALLDAMSEEINNSIFRLGHYNLGMSAALIGSGMAFRYNLFKHTMGNIHAVGGFDRELELKLLYRKKYFHYMQDTIVWDEKIQNRKDFSNQRRRWLSAQWHYSVTFGRYFFESIIRRRWDFCDKLFQQFSIPRLLLIGFTFIIAVFWSLFGWSWSLKWWILFSILFFSLLIAIPRRFYTRQLLAAVCSIPMVFVTMLLSIFKLRGANKKFIHTKHGIVNER
jgi:cellulose synthase/poly-beta-1,6-N-acetylglucosamine synthase-like glycosyltransferase